MMTNRNLFLIRHKAQMLYFRSKHWLRQQRWKVGLGLGILLLLYWFGPVHINIHFPSFSQVGASLISPQEAHLANPATAIGAGLTEEQKKQAQKINNLSIVFNEKLQNKLDPQVYAYKKATCEGYIQKHLAIAQEEAKQFNIPISIKLAQGLLETNAGDSQLAKKENNHFGIKCASKCLGCRCANYADDDRYDMFRIFDSPQGSYREHSKLLQKPRYRHLLQLSRSDYRTWAKGLQKAGYATDPRYAEKLITIIEFFQLHQYDR